MCKMKKLVIVSTRPDGGIGGGIPSALIGYMNGLDNKGVSKLPGQDIECKCKLTCNIL